MIFWVIGGKLGCNWALITAAAIGVTPAVILLASLGYVMFVLPYQKISAWVKKIIAKK